mgnify:CR=1 FL=1
MTIEELAKQKVNSMPNSILVKYYEAGIPQWHMEAILTMLKQKKIVSFTGIYFKICFIWDR